MVLNVLYTPQQYSSDITAVLGCSFSLSACHPPAPLNPAAFLSIFSLPCCHRIRSLTASLNTYTSKRKRKGKQEGRGRTSDKRPGAAESKNRGGRTSKWQRRRKTGKRVHHQDWKSVWGKCRVRTVKRLESDRRTNWTLEYLCPCVSAGRVEAEKFVKWTLLEIVCSNV